MSRKLREAIVSRNRRSCPDRDPDRKPCPDKDCDRNGNVSRIKANVDFAVPNKCGDIYLLGGSNISTVGRDHTVFINSINTQLYDYVVAQDGTSTYYTLKEAVAQVIADGVTQANILVKSGEYELPNLENTVAINFIASSMGGNPSVTLHGYTRSHGNKSWYGFRFRGIATGGPDGQNTYLVSDDQSSTLYSEYFNNCIFTENFRIEVTGELIIFDNCLFDYNNINRDRLIIVNAGRGYIQAFNCSFVIERFGQAPPSVTTFMSMGANTQNTMTLAKDCNMTLEVQGPTPYYVFNVEGSQNIHIDNFVIAVRNSNCQKIVMIGHPTAANNIRLKFLNSTVTVESGSDTAIVNVLSNLWSMQPLNGIVENITITNCNFFRVRLLYYDDTSYELSNYIEVSGCNVSSWAHTTVDLTVRVQLGHRFQLTIKNSPIQSNYLGNSAFLIDSNVIADPPVNLQSVVLIMQALTISYMNELSGIYPVGSPATIIPWGRAILAGSVFIGYADVRALGFAPTFLNVGAGDMAVLPSAL